MPPLPSCTVRAERGSAQDEDPERHRQVGLSEDDGGRTEVVHQPRVVSGAPVRPAVAARPQRRPDQDLVGARRTHARYSAPTYCLFCLY